MLILGYCYFDRRWNMSQVNPKTKIYFWLSVTQLLCGIVSWIPYLLFKIEESYGMLPFVLNPIGVVSGSFSNNRLIALSNLLWSLVIPCDICISNKKVHSYVIVRGIFWHSIKLYIEVTCAIAVNQICHLGRFFLCK